MLIYSISKLLNLFIILLHFCLSLKKQLACCSSFYGFSILEQPLLYIFSLFHCQLTTVNCQLLRGEYRARTLDPPVLRRDALSQLS